jgi:hypothetical protein
MECIHSKFINAKSYKYATCGTCGTLLKVTKDNNIPVIKHGLTYSDLCWQDIYNNMKIQSESIKLNKLSDKYISSRRELIDYMKHLNNKFKYSDITLYLGIYLLDIIGNNENLIENYNFELIVVACLLLSCNCC